VALKICRIRLFLLANNQSDIWLGIPDGMLVDLAFNGMVLFAF
jgi:hypothetical protein